jgi:hypothetical protein
LKEEFEDTNVLAEYDLTEVVDSSAEELELSNTKYITDVVDSSVEELQLSNTKYITDVVDSSAEELQTIQKTQ